MHRTKFPVKPHMHEIIGFGRIIFGQFTDMQDTGAPFGFTLEDIIREHTDHLNIPVVMNAPFGHGGDLYCLPVGQKAQLHVKGDDVELKLL